MGTSENNPPRQDIEEIGGKTRIHLALNAILNHDRKITKVLAGEPSAVMEAGIPLSREVSQVAVKSKYRLAITSTGGCPKDINVYQAQKGSAHAALIPQPEGTIILAAACPDVSDSPHYEDWVRGKSSHTEVIEQFEKNEFRKGPHKAFQIARAGAIFNLLSYTELNEKLANGLLLDPIVDEYCHQYRPI